METMKITKEKADSLVKEILIENTDLDYDARIETYVVERKIAYEIIGKVLYNGQTYEKRTPLKKMEYITLLKIALSKKGYEVTFIKPLFRKEKVQYEIFFYLLEKDEEMKRKRKK